MLSNITTPQANTLDFKNQCLKQEIAEELNKPLSDELKNLLKNIQKIVSVKTA